MSLLSKTFVDRRSFIVLIGRRVIEARRVIFSIPCTQATGVHRTISRAVNNNWPQQLDVGGAEGQMPFRLLTAHLPRCFVDVSLSTSGVARMWIGGGGLASLFLLSFLPPPFPSLFPCLLSFLAPPFRIGTPQIPAGRSGRAVWVSQSQPKLNLMQL